MNQQKRKQRQRYKMKKNNKRSLPRLIIFCSEKNIHAQIVQDKQFGKVIASVSSCQKFVKDRLTEKAKSYNVQGAFLVGEALGKIAQEKEILEVVFDRGAKPYHGRIKSFAEGVRKYIKI